MVLDLPDLPESSAEELKLELACALYSRGKISAVSGARLAGVDLFAFQAALKERRVPRQYGPTELREDMDALRTLFPA